MQPTMKLRYVWRSAGCEASGKTEHGDLVYQNLVLQQWFDDPRKDAWMLTGAHGEWRDIPLEEE